jgi:hypothetical protein
MGCGRKSLCVDEYSSQAGNLFRRSPFARLLFLFYLVPLDMFPPLLFFGYLFTWLTKTQIVLHLWVFYVLAYVTPEIHGPDDLKR